MSIAGLARVVSIMGALLLAGGARAADEAHTDWKGRIKMLRDGCEFRKVSTDVYVALPKWSRSFNLQESRRARREKRDGVRRFTGVLPAGDANAIAFEKTIEEGGGKVRVSLRVTARNDMEVAGVFLFVYWPVGAFADGRCEMLEPQADPNKPTATTMPAKLPEDHHFLDGKSKGVAATAAGGATRLRVELDRLVPTTLQDGRKWKDRRYSAFFQLLGGKLRKGQAASLTATLKLTVPQDRRPARLALDASRKRYRLAGFGGNFVYGVDSPITRHNLANLKIAWARTGMKLEQWEPTNDNDSPDEINWAFFEARDRPGSELRADFLLARRLARRKIPYATSVWRVPAFMTDHPERDPYSGKRTIPRDKWPEMMESIGAYLLYAKRKYGAEAELFSFNESDSGVYVKMTPEEHRDLIKQFGAHLAKLGLKTRMLLGDGAKRGYTAFVEPAAKDPDAMKHVGALAFHTWGRRPEDYRAWRRVARRLKLPLLAAEVGPDASAWRDRSFNTLHYFAREIRMYQEILLHADPHALLEWEYTADYRMVETERGPDGAERLKPTPRFWMIQQFANLTPQPAWALHTASDHPGVLLTAFAGTGKDSARLTLHVANPGAARPAALTGLPRRIESLRAVQTTWDRHREKLPAVKARDGRVELQLPGFSLLTLTSEAPSP
jgi:hypothetical protein